MEATLRGSLKSYLGEDGSKVGIEYDYLRYKYPQILNLCSNPTILNKVRKATPI